MTSTSFNIGLGEGRNSSRILKPPGGGHSDIFGIHEEKPISKKQAAVPPVNNIIISDKPANEEEKEQDENIEEKPIEEPKQLPTVPKVRVPPGGFSSGLW